MQAAKVVVRDGVFTGVRIFSSTLSAARAQLGDEVTRWMEAHPQYQTTELVQTQSSDRAYHCLTITLFYRER